jgi:hypothetical protein
MISLRYNCLFFAEGYRAAEELSRATKTNDQEKKSSGKYDS